MTAVEWLYNNLLLNPISNEDIEYNEAVFENAKVLDEQQQKMYSEEEVFHILVKAMKDNKVNQLSFFDNGVSNPIYTNLKKWFEQFKKK